MNEVRYDEDINGIEVTNYCAGTTLGKLIDQLQSFYDEDPDCGVYLVFPWKENAEEHENLRCPGRIHSWRGVYQFAAVEPGNGFMPLSDFFMRLRGVIGMTLQGYKGGDYVMTEDTPLYVENEGMYTRESVYVDYVKHFGCGGVALVCGREQN